MTPAKIDGFTNILGKPRDWDQLTTESCGELHVRVEKMDDTIACFSAWLPTDEEIDRIVARKPVILKVAGGQPAVMLSVPE